MKRISLLFTITLLLVSCAGNIQNRNNNTNLTHSLRDTNIVVPIKTSNEDNPSLNILTAQDYFIRMYDGRIGKYPIELVLLNWGDGTLDGYYHYKKTPNLKLKLQGEIDLDESVVVKEFVGEQETGSFAFSFIDIDHITGTWKKFDGSKERPFDLNAIPENDPNAWAGAWHLNGIWNSGIIVIGNVQKKQFDFGLHVLQNGAYAFLMGRATVKGKEAWYKEDLKFSDHTCTINFERKDNHIIVTQKSDNGDCGFGMRTSASGHYENRLINKKPVLTVGETAVFMKQKNHDIFKDEVGEKTYEDFAYNFQMILKSEWYNDSILKRIHISEGAVSGLFTSNEAIIIQNEKGKYWAANLEPRIDDVVLHYYTNDQSMKKKLPKVIHKWRERFKEYKVEFH